MSERSGLRLTAVLVVLILFAMQIQSHPQKSEPVSPARIVPMQNLETEVARSGRPAYLPAEWGRVVAVERLGANAVTLVLEAENGELRFVVLTQRGAYFYLDTNDQGGVVTLLSRQP